MRVSMFFTVASVCAGVFYGGAASADVVVDWVDDDWDGVVEDRDPDDHDPCVPSVDSSRCDKDGDGVDNGLEWGRGTDDDNADSDGDGVSDFDEGDDDENGNGVTDALDVCVPVGCSDEDAVEVGSVDEVAVADRVGPDSVDGGCQQSAVTPALLALLVLALTNTRQRTAPATLSWWTAPPAALAPRRQRPVALRGLRAAR